MSGSNTSRPSIETVASSRSARGQSRARTGLDTAAGGGMDGSFLAGLASAASAAAGGTIFGSGPARSFQAAQAHPSSNTAAAPAPLQRSHGGTVFMDPARWRLPVGAACRRSSPSSQASGDSAAAGGAAPPAGIRTGCEAAGRWRGPARPRRRGPWGPVCSWGLVCRTCRAGYPCVSDREADSSPRPSFCRKRTLTDPS